MTNNLVYPSTFFIEDITKGYIFSKKQYLTLLLDKNLEDIYQSNSNFLIIYAIYPKLTRITCYPLNIKEVWKLKIILNEANHKTLNAITELFIPNQTIHTTGLSQKNDVYVVENYLQPQTSWDKAKVLIQKIQKIKGILKSQMELLSIRN